MTALTGERTDFLNTTVLELLGGCLHPTDYETWCGPHDSLWMPDEATCRKVGDMQAFAGQVIEQWDRRPGARAATERLRAHLAESERQFQAKVAALTFAQGTIDDLAAQVRVLEEERDG